MSESALSVSENVRWTSLARGGSLLLQLVGVGLLARLLPASDFGLMALALAVAAFANLVRDLGTSAAIVQAETLDPRLINAVWWLSAGVGAVMTLATIAASGALARLFSQAGLQSVLVALSPAFFVAAVAAPHQALLERESRFRSLAFIELSASAAGWTLAAVLAWRGAGVFALVGQTLATATLGSIFLWLRSGWLPGAPRSLTGLRNLVPFSGNLFVFNFLNFVHRNADSAMIGRFLGASALGFYNLAYRLMLFPLQNVTFVLGRAMLPTYSRAQGRQEAIALHYLSVLETIALLVAPLMGVAWALREPLVSTVFGQRWAPSAAVVGWLAPVGLAQSLVSSSGTVLTSLGLTRSLRRLGGFGVPFLIVAMAVGLPFGIVGVAMSYCVANVVWVVPVLVTCAHALRTSFRTMAQRLLPPLAIGFGIAALVRLLVHLCARWAPAPPLLLAGGSFTALLAFATTCRLFFPGAVRQLWMLALGRPGK